MTPEREQEIRTLAAGLAANPRHRRIAAVVAELLDELDAARREAAEARQEAEEIAEIYPGESAYDLDRRPMS